VICHICSCSSIIVVVDEDDDESKNEEDIHHQWLVSLMKLEDEKKKIE
jgi:hypothetical protein